MKKTIYALAVSFALLGCDSIPKKMSAEKINPLTTDDQIQISVECQEQANPYRGAEFKNYIMAKLYIVNSGQTPIEFTPAKLITPDSSDLTFSGASGGKMAKTISQLRDSKSIIIPTGEDYLINLTFGSKKDTLPTTSTFKISGMMIDKQKRSPESIICQSLASSYNNGK